MKAKGGTPILKTLKGILLRGYFVMARQGEISGSVVREQYGGHIPSESRCAECARLQKELEVYKDVESFFDWVVEDAEDESQLVKLIVIWIRTRHLDNIDKYVSLREFSEAAQIKP